MEGVPGVHEVSGAAVVLVGKEAGPDDVDVFHLGGDGEAVRVIDDDWDHGPGFGFLVFPLLVTGIVLPSSGTSN